MRRYIGMREGREFVDALREALGLAPLYRGDRPSPIATRGGDGDHGWDIDGNRRVPRKPVCP